VLDTGFVQIARQFTDSHRRIQARSAESDTSAATKNVSGACGAAGRMKHTGDLSADRNVVVVIKAPTDIQVPVSRRELGQKRKPLHTPPLDYS
jgi:hypothetical protein